MKTMRFLILFCYASLQLLATMTFNACSHDMNDKEIVPRADVTFFSPLSGGRNTLLTLNGHNFGNDPAKIRVTLNGKELIVKSVSDEEIKAEAPKGSNSGILRIILGERPNAQVLIYDTEFTYISNFEVTTWLGGDTGGENDGPFETATLLKPRFLKWSENGALYIIEDGVGNASDLQSIRIAQNNTLQTIIDAASTSLIARIRAIDFSSDDNTMYIANDKNSSGTMGFGSMKRNGTNFIGLQDLWPDQTSAITFTKVHPITGDVFVGVHANAVVYRFDGMNFIGGVRLPASTEGTFADKGNINGMAFDKEGTTVYIVSRARHVIYKGEYNLNTREIKNLKILAGKYATTGYSDGIGTNALFNSPCQADIDEEGNLYVADRGNHCIRIITPEGEVSTYAGKNISGMRDGIASQAEFNNPEGCQFGPDGALYIADYSNNRIRKIEDSSSE